MQLPLNIGKSAMQLPLNTGASGLLPASYASTFRFRSMTAPLSDHLAIRNDEYTHWSDAARSLSAFRPASNDDFGRPQKPSFTPKFRHFPYFCKKSHPTGRSVRKFFLLLSAFGQSARTDILRSVSALSGLANTTNMSDRISRTNAHCLLLLKHSPYVNNNSRGVTVYFHEGAWSCLQDGKHADFSPRFSFCLPLSSRVTKLSVEEHGNTPDCFVVRNDKNSK
jgi:hypothetical protein